jgi:hypothetical protein
MKITPLICPGALMIAATGRFVVTDRPVDRKFAMLYLMQHNYTLEHLFKLVSEHNVEELRSLQASFFLV